MPPASKPTVLNMSLLDRISMSKGLENQAKSRKSQRSLFAHLSSHTPSLLMRLGPPQTGNDLELQMSQPSMCLPLRETNLSHSPSLILMENNPNLVPCQPYSLNSTEWTSSPLKRKMQPSDCTVLKSKRPKLVQHPNSAGNLQNLPKSKGELNLLAWLSSLTIEGHISPMTNLGLTTKMMKTNLDEKGHGSKSQICRGISEQMQAYQDLIQVVPKQSIYYEPSTKTSSSASSSSVSPPEYQKMSLPHSGSESSEENPSISTKLCLLSTRLLWLKKGRHALETEISYLDLLKRQGRLPRPPTGQQLGVGQQGQLPLSFPTGSRNLKIMPSTLKMSSLQKTRPDIIKSSSTMLPSEISSAEDNRYCLPTSTDLQPSIPPLLCRMESNTHWLETGGYLEGLREKCAIDSMIKGAIPQSVDIDMHANFAEAQTMEKQHVAPPQRIEVDYGMRPKYLRYNIWNPEGNLSVTTAEWTETATPLP